MRPSIIYQNKNIKILSSISKSLEDLLQWTTFVRSFLSKVIPSNMTIITISPQKYSLGYEFDSFREERIGNKKILINENILLNAHLLEIICESEEFERGLLILFEGDYKNQLRNLEDLYQITDRVIFLDADGSILNLLNFDNSIEIEAIFNVCLGAHYPNAK